LLNDEENIHIERRNTDLILNQTEPTLAAVPKFISTEGVLQIQTDHFATHSRGNTRREAQEEKILHEPTIKRRAYLYFHILGSRKKVIRG